MERVLVTGGAGFLGSHLVEHLITLGLDVTVIDDFSAAPRDNLAGILGHVSLVDGDVRDPSIHGRIEAVDTIIHLAANANVPRSSEDPLFDASTNILGTVNMLELARARGARFVLASSGAVYGEPADAPMAEDHPLKPISPYGVSKLAAENYVRLYNRLFGVNAVILRFFNMYGPRQRRFVVFDFAEKIRQQGNEVLLLGSGRQMRSQLYVDDAVDAVLLVLQSGTGEVYNIGSTTVMSVTNIMHHVLATFGVAKKLRVSQRSWDGDIQRLVPDVRKLGALGFQEKVPFVVGLCRFREWYLSTYVSSDR